MKRVIVHIDRLVLNGFNSGDRLAISAGLQQELSSLLADPQAVQALSNQGNIARLKPGRTRIAPGSEPQHVGAQVAQGIGKGIMK